LIGGRWSRSRAAWNFRLGGGRFLLETPGGFFFEAVFKTDAAVPEAETPENAVLPVPKIAEAADGSGDDPPKYATELGSGGEGVVGSGKKEIRSFAYSEKEVVRPNGVTERPDESVTRPKSARDFNRNWLETEESTLREVFERIFPVRKSVRTDPETEDSEKNPEAVFVFDSKSPPVSEYRNTPGRATEPVTVSEYVISSWSNRASASESTMRRNSGVALVRDVGVESGEFDSAFAASVVSSEVSSSKIPSTEPEPSLGTVVSVGVSPEPLPSEETEDSTGSLAFGSSDSRTSGDSVPSAFSSSATSEGSVEGGGSWGGSSDDVGSSDGCDVPPELEDSTDGEDSTPSDDSATPIAQIGDVGAGDRKTGTPFVLVAYEKVSSRIHEEV
jgi:hypothetical protein